VPTLDFTLNGKPISVEVQPHEFLAEVLRYRLGLTGTKIGCNEAECGICTVIVDGQSIDSCIYPALKAQGRYVETIEGLAATSRQGSVVSGQWSRWSLTTVHWPLVMGSERRRRSPPPRWR